MNKTLQEFLSEKNIKQKDVADALNKHESTISLKLTGERAFTLDELFALSKLTGLSLNTIYEAIGFAKCKKK